MELDMNIKGRWIEWLEEKNRSNKDIALILHIGMEKTGSKTIQTWLNDQRENLNDDGWYVPNTMGRINHRKITYLGFDKDHRDDGTNNRGINTEKKMTEYQIEILNELKKEVLQAKTENSKAMIISSELASSRLIKKREIKRFIEKIRETEIGPILIILFRRNPDELIESHHSTAVIYEGRKSFHPPKAGNSELKKFGEQKKLQSKWVNIAEKDGNIDIEIYNYNRQILVDGSSVATIAELMNVSENLKNKAKGFYINKSLSAINIRALVILNILEKLLKRKTRMVTELREKLIEKQIGVKKYTLPKQLRKDYISYYKLDRLKSAKELIVYSSWK